jgi:hypothetical protein
MAFRKNTFAELASPTCVPEATTCDDVSFENPVSGSSDHRTFAFCSEGLELIESTQARDARTFRDKPCVEGLTPLALTAEIDVRESEATCTFTRGGTVTVTVCVRLLEDPR